MPTLNKRLEDLERKVDSIHGRERDIYFDKLLDQLPNLPPSRIEQLEVLLFSDKFKSWEQIYKRFKL